LKTKHKIIFSNSQNMSDVLSEGVDLVVTSPPYPMIEMWDKMFFAQNPEIDSALSTDKGLDAFELMHCELDSVWNEVYRVLVKGGIACINIGDAVRTLDGNFVLYPNHSRIVSHMIKKGFLPLPEILWRKQTNAPNKFMGSGMMPPGAYVTLEHEYILVFRKGRKKEFKTAEQKQNRRNSAYFWEERNNWFSDVWTDLKGSSQNLFDNKVRKRSASFPFEVPYRLINMFSVKGDIVLDPFAGTGTTAFASIASCRNSISYEIEQDFKDIIFSKLEEIVLFSNNQINQRIEKHLDFVKKRFNKKGGFKHKNNYYGFPVITKQEQELIINSLDSVVENGENIVDAVYFESPQEEFCTDWKEYFVSPEKNNVKLKPQIKKNEKKNENNEKTKSPNNKKIKEQMSLLD